MRAVTASRFAGRQASRPLEFPSKATMADARLVQISYLHGWWYAVTDYLGFVGVRVRLPGDVSGPSPRAREALLEIERRAPRLTRQLDPHLWAYYRAQSEARETDRVRSIRTAAPAEPGTILRNHFRLDAVCAGAYGEPGAVELALEPRWMPGRWLGAYLENGQLTEFLSSIHAWRTPDGLA
jgi:hypothetical protein